MLITRETDYALRMLRVLLDGEKHSAAEMAETELIPMQFAYQILRKLSAGELVQVSRGAAGGCRLSCDLRGVSLVMSISLHLLFGLYIHSINLDKSCQDIFGRIVLPFCHIPKKRTALPRKISER